MEFSELRTIGLSKGEIKVYSAILNLGGSSVNKIHERSGMERRTVYDILSKLVEKGLVTYVTQKGKKHYKCAPLSKLKEELKSKKQELEGFEKKLPLLEEIYSSSKHATDFEIYKGKEGIKTIFEDMLNYKEVRFIGGRWYITKEMPVYWSHYNKRRIKNKVKWINLILDDSPKQPTKNFVELKILPKEFNGAPSILIIYGSKVVNILWGDDLFAFSIESKAIADNHKKYHQYLWDNVAKTP